MLSARQSNLRTELPKRRSARAEQVKEKWLEFDPDVKDIQAQQARGTSYEKQLPLLLQRTGSRFTKYAQRDLNRRVKHFIQSGDLGFTLYVSPVLPPFFHMSRKLCCSDSMLLTGTTVITRARTKRAG
jgi:hypothetical protein